MHFFQKYKKPHVHMRYCFVLNFWLSPLRRLLSMEQSSAQFINTVIVNLDLDWGVTLKWIVSYFKMPQTVIIWILMLESEDKDIFESLKHCNDRHFSQKWHHSFQIIRLSRPCGSLPITYHSFSEVSEVISMMQICIIWASVVYSWNNFCRICTHLFYG